MNMKSLSVILGGISVFALGACTVTGTGSTSTGSGGGTTTATTTTTTGGVGGSGGGTTTTTSTTTTGGAGGCDAMYTCAEAITPPNGDSTKLCNGPAGDAYDAYYKCVCDATGPCGTACGMAYCTGTAPTAECTTCIQDNTDKGCKKEADTCAAN